MNFLFQTNRYVKVKANINLSCSDFSLHERFFNYCFRFKHSSALGEHVNSSPVTPPPALFLMVQCAALNITRTNAFPKPQIKVCISTERVVASTKDAKLGLAYLGRI
jgi:hypothetical protein